MIGHAVKHREAGYPLPTKWLGAADTFASHVAKTHETFEEPFWRGTWSLRQGGHVAVFTIDGTELVHLRLLGVEDQGGMDRLRAAAHGLWFEEPAPSSILVQSSGLSETSWGIGITSCRLPSYRNPKIMTLNYPDEEHWTWQKFVVRKDPGTRYVRIPPGERASAEQRARWTQALAHRPDILRRLIQGQPGVVILGEQVAVGFNQDVHAPHGLQLRPDPSATLWIGQDGGLTPTSVIGQRQGRRRLILGAVSSEHDGILQHFRGLLIPWLSEHCPWALELGTNESERLQLVYDPSMHADGQGDTEANPLKVMRRQLSAHYRPGPGKWDPRNQALLNALGDMAGGEPALQVDPVKARGLVKALTGGWHYPTGQDGKVRRDEPIKNHPHSDYGDALCYLLSGMSPSKADQLPRKPYQAQGGASTPHQLSRPMKRQPGVGVLIPSRSW